MYIFLLGIDIFPSDIIDPGIFTRDVYYHGSRYLLQHLNTRRLCTDNQVL